MENSQPLGQAEIRVAQVLAAKGHRGNGGQGPDNAADLSPEARLQQLELEMQNDELRRVQATLGAELAAARDAAEAAHRAKSIFLANISHELRTPMTGIMGMTDLALRHATDPKQIDWLNKSQASARRLLAIINDLLDLSRIEADLLPLAESSFSLAAIIEDVLRESREPALAKGLQLTLKTALAPPDFLIGDALRLKQIVLNLLANAIKFSESGQITLSTQISEDDSDSVLLRIEVSDQGIGLDPAQQNRLFQAFAQADDAANRKYGGTGTGLIIARRLARLMGGDAGVVSTAGVGSTFWVTARLRRTIDGGFKSESLAPSCTQTQSPEAGATASAREMLVRHFHGRHVLLVEDDLLSQEVLACLLEAVGLVPDVVGNSEEALARLRIYGSVYALVLINEQLALISGVDATQTIRQLPGMSAIPLLAMTADSIDEDRQRCQDAGMADCIATPVQPDALYEAVWHCLQTSKAMC